MKNENDTFKAYERRERREALEMLERDLLRIKHSLYGLAGFDLEKDSPLHKLKMSVTDCISQAWRLKEGVNK